MPGWVGIFLSQADLRSGTGSGAGGGGCSSASSSSVSTGASAPSGSAGAGSLFVTGGIGMSSKSPGLVVTRRLARGPSRLPANDDS